MFICGANLDDMRRLTNPRDRSYAGHKLLLGCEPPSRVMSHVRVHFLDRNPKIVGHRIRNMLYGGGIVSQPYYFGLCAHEGDHIGGVVSQ